MIELSVPVRLTHMWRRRGDRAIVVSDANFNLVRFEFNRIGTRVWELADSTRSLCEIVDQIAVENPTVPRQFIVSSVDEFVDHLHSEWLMMTKEELTSYE